MPGPQSSKKKQKMKEMPSPTVMRNGSLAKSTELSPSMFTKGSISKFKRLPTAAQRGVIKDARKVLKNLEEFLKEKEGQPSVEEFLQQGGSSGGGGTSREHAASSPPQHRKPKYQASPSPEPLRGNPHHPARDGSRSSRALPGFSPGK